MFITSKRRGYTQDGQQVASGLFLILVQPKTSDKYPMHAPTCANCGRDSEAHEKSAKIPIPTCSKHGVIARLRQRAAGVQPTDADFIESPVSGCTECDARIAAEKLAGCRYFKSTYITYPIRALVRHVSMSQCGQFMMGFARVHGERLTLSGSYGGDGLPDTVSDKVYELAVPLPEYLYEAWKNGGGWNSAGNEALQMQEWALANLKALRA